MTIALISHPECRLHQMGPYHPERPERLGAIEDRLIAAGLEVAVRHYDAPPVTREALLRVHDEDYLNLLETHAPDSGLVWIDGDTALGQHSLKAAFRAAGAAVLAVDLVLGGQAESAFCNVRPPGHHAERRRAMGFCFFNNVAVAAAHALAVHGLERVAVVDFDVHHGNGTEDIFGGDVRVLFCSSFEQGIYPHSGHDTELPNVVNLPLPAGTDGRRLMDAAAAHWFPRLESFAPELLLISAGFDGHLEDDLAHFRLRDEDYRELTRQLKKIADRHCQGRVVSVLEGGYSLSALGRSAVQHLDALLGH